MENQRKIGYDQNSQPPKNYIGYKNGQYLEGIDDRGVANGGLNPNTTYVDTKIGDLNNLGTTNKDNLVSAINEVAQIGSSSSEHSIALTVSKIPTASDIGEHAGDTFLTYFGISEGNGRDLVRGEIYTLKTSDSKYAKILGYSRDLWEENPMQDNPFYIETLILGTIESDSFKIYKMKFVGNIMDAEHGYYGFGLVISEVFSEQ